MTRGRRGRRLVRLCDALVPLRSGGVYVCGRHTKDKLGRCQVHRPPPATKRPPDLFLPRRITEET